VGSARAFIFLSLSLSLSLFFFLSLSRRHIPRKSYGAVGERDTSRIKRLKSTLGVSFRAIAY